MMNPRRLDRAMRYTITILTVALLALATTAHAATVSGTVAAGAALENIDLARSVVYFESNPAILPGAPYDGHRPQIAQHGKAFTPDFSVVVVGTTVEFPNWDPFSHNVFSRSRAASFDLDRYGEGQSKSYTFNNPGVVQLFCNIHPQMKAVLLVVPNRCFARADAQGRFSISDVPPGQYMLVGWNDRAGEQRQTIDVPPDGLQGLTVTLSAAAVREPIVPRSAPPEPSGVARGLGVKRERLDLPVVGDQHPAPNP
jgi:plastocyanin